MNKFEKLEELFDQIIKEGAAVLGETERGIEAEFKLLLDNIRKGLAEYKATGILPTSVSKSIAAAESICNGEPNSITSSGESSAKENDSEAANHSKPKTSTRKQRLTGVKSKLSTIKLCNKPIVKLERITENFDTLQIDAPALSTRFKREAEEMPPPPQPLFKRLRAQKTSLINGRILKKELIDDNYQSKVSGRESDVVVQTSNILNITVMDSDEETQPAKVKPKRTRTKKQLVNTTSITSASEESENEAKKRHPDVMGSTRSTRTRAKTALQSHNVQEQQVPDVHLDKTVVLSKPNNMNTTVVILKNNAAVNETFIKSKPPLDNLEKQLLTDDEDIVENSVKETRAKKKKQIFSPYAGSPVKKRVAAFEKLEAARAEPNARPTRANTKKKNTTSEEEDRSPPTNNKTKTAIPKLRITPIVESRSVSQSQPKSVDRPLNPLIKSKSELKASQAEFRERELRRKQKETDAQLKKDALIAAQAEEKRRRNEERQLKAQQHRDEMEKEKQQMLEAAENAKVSKIKQMMAEKEEKLRKQKEEAIKKRQLVLKKQQEEKRQPELEIKKQGDRPDVQNSELPLLPTSDCYDSDDSSRGGKRIVKRSWQTGHTLLTTQKCMTYLGGIEKKLFSCRPQCPDVRRIFPGSKPLHRNSSVVWDTTNMSIMEEED